MKLNDFEKNGLSASIEEFELYYATFPSKLSALEEELHVIRVQHSDWSPFRLKASGYELMAERCPIKIFRHFPFYFEMDVGKERTDLGNGGIGGWMRASPLAGRLIDQGNEWYKQCGDSGLSSAWPVLDDNHLCLGNDVVFQHGLRGLIQEAEQRMATAKSEKERDFLDSIIAGNRALIKLANRFADEAKRMLMDEQDPDVWTSLQRIAETAARVPAEPPQTFYEAVATLLFMRETTQSLEGSGISMLGHLDRILWPYYERDIAQKGITRHQAKELLAYLLVFPGTRLGIRTLGNHYGTNISVGIGGCSADGAPIFNELTEIIIEVYRELHLVDPKLHARVSTGHPKEYIVRLAELAASGFNALAIFNDDVIIAANEKAGKRITDCRFYVGGGCQENILENTESNNRATIYLNLLQVLMMGFAPGRWDWFMDREKIKLNEYASSETFDSFYQEFLGNLKAVVDAHIEQRNRTEREGWRYNPCPLLSSTILDCIANAKDLIEGGARYNSSSVGLTGAGTLIDSLFAIREIVYIRRQVNLSELFAALESDFAGHEKLRAMLVHLPKYGQEGDAIHAFSAQVFADLARVSSGKSNTRGGRYEASLFSFRLFTSFGERTGATPDGRHAGEHLSSGMSPSMLALGDGSSIGQVLRALEPLDLSDYPVVAVLDVKLPIAPNSFPPEILVSVFHRFLISGGSVLQLNIADPEVLRDAKEHPQRHTDLVVRISGYSAYFTTLPEKVQDEIIERAEVCI